MLIIKRTLNALTNHCKRGWLNTEWYCFFNAKCGLSLALTINFLTVLTLALGKHKLTKSFFELMIIATVSIFILLSLFYSKKEVLSITISRPKENKIFVMVLLYMGVSVLLLIASSSLRD